MQNEALFIALDTAMMSICTGLQTFVHPGIFFPAMTQPYHGEGQEKMEMVDTPPEYKVQNADGERMRDQQVLGRAV